MCQVSQLLHSLLSQQNLGSYLAGGEPKCKTRLLLWNSLHFSLSCSSLRFSMCITHGQSLGCNQLHQVHIGIVKWLNMTSTTIILINLLLNFYTLASKKMPGFKGYLRRYYFCSKNVLPNWISWLEIKAVGMWLGLWGGVVVVVVVWCRCRCWLVVGVFFCLPIA